MIKRQEVLLLRLDFSAAIQVLWVGTTRTEKRPFFSDVSPPVPADRGVCATNSGKVHGQYFAVHSKEWSLVRLWE